MNLKLVSVVFAGLLSCLYANAQIRLGPGQISASLESNSVYYINDETIGEAPEDKFGTNNYLKLDYTLGRFSAGVQVEAYTGIVVVEHAIQVLVMQQKIVTLQQQG